MSMEDKLLIAAPIAALWLWCCVLLLMAIVQHLRGGRDE